MNKPHNTPIVKTKKHYIKHYHHVDKAKLTGELTVKKKKSKAIPFGSARNNPLPYFPNLYQGLINLLASLDE